MLSSKSLRKLRQKAELDLARLAGMIARSGLTEQEALTALRNWERGLLQPQPTKADIDALARALGTERENLVLWTATHRYAPMAPRKVRLVTELIQGRTVQDALDTLKFTNKRAAVFVDKVLRSAVANADEQEADVERLYVYEARVDEGGVRTGTRRWRPKDRGRAMPWTRLACHIHVCLALE